MSIFFIKNLIKKLERKEMAKLLIAVRLGEAK